jgi:hypothetical protein
MSHRRVFHKPGTLVSDVRCTVTFTRYVCLVAATAGLAAGALAPAALASQTEPPANPLTSALSETQAMSGMVAQCEQTPALNAQVQADPTMSASALQALCQKYGKPVPAAIVGATPNVVSRCANTGCDGVNL